MYTGRDTCALSKSLNFTCFGSKNTLFLFDNEVHSEKCIVFYRFPEEDFFYSVRTCLNISGVLYVFITRYEM